MLQTRPARDLGSSVRHRVPIPPIHLDLIPKYCRSFVQLFTSCPFVVIASLRPDSVGKCTTKKKEIEHENTDGVNVHDQLGNTGRKTGFWLEEFAAPYFVFRDAGVQLTLASPKGGQPPVDPKSDLPENQTSAMSRFKQDDVAKAALARTVKLEEVKAGDFDTVFYVGGHGPLWDLAESRASIPCRVLLQLGKANCLGVPLPRCTASRHI